MISDYPFHVFLDYNLLFLSCLTWFRSISVILEATVKRLSIPYRDEKRDLKHSFSMVNNNIPNCSSYKI